MSLESTYCSYHSKKIAVNICQRCHRPICLEDVREYNPKYSVIYCILCNYAVTSSSHKWIPLLFVVTIPMSIPFFYLSLVSIEILLQLILLFSAIVILISPFFVITHNRNLRKKLEFEAKNFRNSLKNPNTLFMNQGSSGNIIKAPNQTNKSSIEGENPSLISLACFECRQDLAPSEKFCSNCGHTTKEELEKHYSQNY